ncbi:T9SS type A sorting domain-containing protein [Saccharicrinis sp. FJH62]|uniref:T9SS type A sorting domain-containing protein n=1 Tax=Saccharicrinis sp. FJH62 TaxID=3344657 RepID=UPI0035D45C4D
MKPFIFALILNITLVNISLTQDGGCDCYQIEDFWIKSQDTLSLTLSNTCDNSVYLDIYLISSKSPFDTLARQEIKNGLFEMNKNTTQDLQTSLTQVPDFGTFRVSITNGTLNCDSIKFSSLYLAIDNINQTDLLIYPNPVKEFLTIDLNVDFSFIKLINVNGQVKLIQRNSNRIDLKGLNSGVYFLEVYDYQYRMIGVQKILKE